MLARLAQVPCAASIEVDHSGRLLRVRAVLNADPETCLDEVTRQLAASGVQVERADADAAVEAAAAARWYGPTNVEELSREEAERLGRDLAASFARLVRLGEDSELELARVIARHFREAFIAQPLEPSASGRAHLEPAITAIREGAGRFLEVSLLEALEAHLRGAMEVKGGH